MSPTLVHDDSVAAVGFAALLTPLLSGKRLNGKCIHIVATGMPCSAGQYSRLAANTGYPAGICVVLESLPPHPDRAKVRVSHGRTFILDAHLSLADMRQAAMFIVSFLREMPLPVWQRHGCLVLRHTGPGLAPRHYGGDSLNRSEYVTLRYLLAGWRMKAIAVFLDLSIKTVSRYKQGLMRKLNVFSRAELHYRLCMEQYILHPDVTRLYRVEVPPVADRPDCHRRHDRLQRYLNQAAVSERGGRPALLADELADGVSGLRDERKGEWKGACK